MRWHRPPETMQLLRDEARLNRELKVPRTLNVTPVTDHKKARVQKEMKIAKQKAIVGSVK